MIGDLFIRFPRMRGDAAVISETSSELPPFAVPGTITEKAVVMDSMGEVDYPIKDAQQGVKDGNFEYVGWRRYGGIVEHCFKFLG